MQTPCRNAPVFDSDNRPRKAHNLMLEALAVSAPIAAAILGWIVRSRLERSRREAEALRSQRTEIYLKLLKPYITIFESIKLTEKARDKALKDALGREWREALFHVNIAGSDKVVKALNRMMQKLYNENPGTDTMEDLGHLLIAIRKDLGNRRTQLTPIDMLASQITDVSALLEAD